MASRRAAAGRLATCAASRACKVKPSRQFHPRPTAVAWQPPVQVTHVDGISLSQPATLDCATATALHRWVTQAMRPALRRDGTRVSRLRVPAHYACRTRNHRPGARISEHGKGRAIDISAIELANGDTVTVRDDWAGSRYSRALRRMHQNACGIFGTTLGPGSDGMHENHFHYDTAEHRGGPYCR
nr:extensin family protein [Roseibaca calidilacus]